MPDPSVPHPTDMSNMSDDDLETLRERVSLEQHARKCSEFLPGSRSCDMGSTQHDVHGFDQYDHNNTPIRVTWKKRRMAA